MAELWPVEDALRHRLSHFKIVQAPADQHRGVAGHVVHVLLGAVEGRVVGVCHVHPLPPRTKRGLE